jgi:hypothetical protein
MVAMKKAIFAVLALVALGLPLLALADTAAPSKTVAGKKRHSTARHHARKSTVGPKRSQAGKHGRHHARTRAHARKSAPADRTPR